MEAIDEWTKRLEQLSDEALMRRTEGLVARCNRLTAALVLHLAEVERRGGHLRQGFGSLFAYCTERLGLSEAASYQRIRAARVVRRRPQVASMLARGELHLSGLSLLAAKLDEPQGEQLLEAARGKSKREIERMLADRDPLPMVPDRIRRLASAAQRGSEQDAIAAKRQTTFPTGGQLVPETAGGQLVPETPGLAESTPLSEAATAAAAPEPQPLRSMVSPSLAMGRRDVGARTVVEIRPLGEERYRIQLTGGAELVRALEKCRALSAHSLHGELGAVIEAALTQYAAHLEKKRFGIGARARGKGKRAARQGGASGTHEAVRIRATEADIRATEADIRAAEADTTQSTCEKAGANGSVGRGQTRARARDNDSAGSSDAGTTKREGGQRSRYVAAEVRRRVAERDGLRCSFRAEDGRRCEQRAYLELDHWRPFALGGANDVANLRLLCRGHNQARNAGLTGPSGGAEPPT
ncbi:MAG: hypothetical protein KC609_08285 [Myxococcales bacterium]|nr:hypothetical protein [Myxococcales bacterium]